MATNKSTSNKWLLCHVLVYAIPFLIIFGWKFAMVNFCFHLVTDYFTSRATTALYKRQEWHWFFCVVGFDQAIHLTTLLLTFSWLSPVAFAGLHLR